MSADVYEILSLAARYLFALLGALAVIRAFFWLVRERSVRHGRNRHAPDMGMVGEMLVLSGCDEAPSGMVIPVPKEGVLGCLRSCDIVVPCPGVSRYHLDFSFEYGKGLMLSPRRGKTAVIDGSPLHSRSGSGAMLHGSVLELGSAVLKLRLFAALDHGAAHTAEPSAYATPPATENTASAYHAASSYPDAAQYNGESRYNDPGIYSEAPASGPEEAPAHQPSQQRFSDDHVRHGGRRGWEDDWGE